MNIRTIYSSATLIAFILACTLLSLQYFEANPLSFETTSYVLLIGTLSLLILLWIRTVVLARENRDGDWTTYFYAT